MVGYRVMKKVEHLLPQEGYDRWAETYDQTLNPVVSMDNRYLPRFLTPAAGESILDAACGTGRHFPLLLGAGSRVIGIDFSLGMLRVARRRFPTVPLLLADLQQPLPIRSARFDTILCSLVGEHLSDLRGVFQEMRRVLCPGGRLVFSVYHPEMAALGIEANFQQGEVEIRLGAYRHTVEDYLQSLQAAGFADLHQHEFCGDAILSAAIPTARKYEGFLLLLILEARTKGERVL